MGLFNSREQTSVGTTVSRVMTDAQIVPSTKTAVIQAIVKDGDITDYLLNGVNNSIGMNAERMYDYAASSYAYGLPSGQFYAATQGTEAVKAILDSQTSGDVQIDYCRLGPANTLHMGWDRLYWIYGYNSTTNQIDALSASVGHPVYLKNMTVIIPSGIFNTLNPKALEQWGTAPGAGYTPSTYPVDSLVQRLVGHKPVVKSDTATNEQILVDYVWASPALVTGSITINLPTINSDAEYFQVKYTLDGRDYYWTYELNSGSYPSLDALFNAPPTLVGEFYPFAYFRFNKTPLNWNTALPGYITTKKMLNLIGINYDQAITSIQANPDIDNVEQAILMMAVPANTTNQLEQRYLYEFFDRLRLSQDTSGNTYDLQNILAQLNTNGQADNTSAIVIQDQVFKMSLSNAGIYTRRVGGVIAARGEYNSAYIEKTGQFIITNSEGIDETHTYTLPCHYYRKQISDSMYDEVEIINLRTTYYIYEGFKTIGDGTDTFLMIPIDRSLTSQYPIPVKEALYSRSLYYVFNSRMVSDVAWYAQDWFKAALLAVAFVMAVFTLGASLDEYAVLVSTGFLTTEAILWSMAVTMLEGIILSLAVNRLIKVVGPQVGIALAIFAAAYALASSSGLVTDLPFADSMLSVSTNLVKATTAEYQSKITDIQSEYEDMVTAAQTVSELIIKAQDLLQTDSTLSPFTFVGEAPEDYYRRTMYSGNVGEASLTSVETFVSRALTLPTLADALGGNFNRAA